MDLKRKTTNRRRGMTLLELLLALGLITLVMAIMFSFYSITLKTRDRGVKMITDGGLARSVALKMADEIRSASGFLGNGMSGVGGTDRLITVQTVVLPDKEMFKPRDFKDKALPAQSDIRQVQYYLAYDDEEEHDYPDGTRGPAPLGLVRREIKTLNQTVVSEDQPEKVELDLYSSEMKYVRFRYFDGVDWVDKWDLGGGLGSMGNSLPQAVEITVGYDELPPPAEEEEGFEFEDSDLTPSLPEAYANNKFTIQVKLPQADTFFGSRLMRAQQRAQKQSEAAGGGTGKGG
jgi:prepilin-type N-terminal cleavage/methylation domain-containing protein